MRARQRDDGSEDPDFVLNKPQFRSAGILVTGQNFGAGSSRESAVWACWPTISASSWREASPTFIGRTVCRTACCRSCLTPADADAFIARVVAADGAAPFTVDLVTPAHQRAGRPRYRVRDIAGGPHAPARRARRYRADAQAHGRDRRLGAAHRGRSALAANRGSRDIARRLRPKKERARDERAKEIPGDHGGQAPRADARRL